MLTRPYIKFILYFALFSFITMAAWGADKIVAKLNGQPILRSELQAEINTSSLTNDLEGLDSTAASKKVLENMLEQRILLMEAKTEKLEPDPKVIQILVNKDKEAWESEAKYKEAMRKKGLTEKQIFQQKKEELAILELLHVHVDTQIKPLNLTDVRAYYDSHKAEFTSPDSVRFRHIFIQMKTEATPAEKELKKKKANEALDLLKKGTDFATVANKFTETDLAANGGDLGRFIRKGELVNFPEVEKVAFELKPGQHSNVIQSQYGYHLIKVEERESGSLKSFDLVKLEIMDKMKKTQAEEIYNQWLGEVKKKYTIEIFPENF